jgi:hypothetical protein
MNKSNHFTFQKSFSFFLSVLLLTALLPGIPPKQNVHAGPLINYVAIKGLTSGFCDSWANACDLQYALTKASSGTELWVTSGTFTPTSGSDRSATFQLKSGVAVYGGFWGNENDRGQRNPVANVSILSGDIGTIGVGTDNSYHVVTGSGTDADAILDGFTISGGYADSPVYFGAGMYTNSGSPTVRNVIFTDNTAEYGGGGMYEQDSESVVTNVVFQNNTAFNASGGSGGGMLNSGGKLQLTNVTFSTNSAYNGGGMHNAGSSPALAYVTFSSNSASNSGAGMYNENSSNPIVNNATFSGNSAGYSGAGMYNENSSPELDNIVFENNTVSGDMGAGGGMLNNSSNPQLTNVTFNGNFVENAGGGISNTSSNPVLTNVTFTNNSAYWGGGMDNDSSSSPSLTNVTFSGNTAQIGGGMDNYNNSTPAITNSILWGNSAIITGDQISDNSSSSSTVTYSDIQGGYAGTGNMNMDPLLGALGTYGGGTEVYPLLPDSPAIDNGDPSPATCPSTDQRSVARPQGGRCDMGAFESRGFNLAVTGGNNQATLINTVFSAPLAISVTSAFSEPVDGGLISLAPPASGALASFPNNPVTVTSGTASTIAVANGTPGSYTVTAGAAGATTPATFHLTNQIAGILRAAPGGLSSGTCNNWGNACDLQYALSITVSGSEIWVKAGTYTPTSGTDRSATFQLKNSVAIYGGFTGNETSREQRNPAANITLLSGEIGAAGPVDNSYHVVTGSGTDDSASLDGFTVKRGYADSPEFYGGGIYNENGSPTLVNLILDGNIAVYGGGGMYNINSNPVLINVAFNNNTVTLLYTNGGGMFNSSSSPTIINATFTGNSATEFGGGIFNNGNSNPTLTNVTFTGNSAHKGGGMFNASSNPTLNNVTMSGNSASEYGGGLANYSSTATFTNSILWANTAASAGAQIYNDGTSSSTVNYSDVQGGCPAGSTCSNVINADPLLGILVNYGSTIQAFPLLPGSPAINTGDSTASNCPVADQRGVSRPQGGRCDMGTFESRGFSLAVTSGDGQSTLVNTAFTHPLALSITSLNSEPVNGGKITFTAPSSGASAVLSSHLVTISSGVVSVIATANGTAGSINITASAAGVASPAIFHLTNKNATPTPSRTRTPTTSPSTTFTPSNLPTSSQTNTPTLTPSPTKTVTPSRTPTPSRTNTGTLPTWTKTFTPSHTPTPTTTVLPNHHLYLPLVIKNNGATASERFLSGDLAAIIDKSRLLWVGFTDFLNQMR